MIYVDESVELVLPRLIFGGFIRDRKRNVDFRRALSIKSIVDNCKWTELERMNITLGRVQVTPRPVLLTSQAQNLNCPLPKLLRDGRCSVRCELNVETLTLSNCLKHIPSFIRKSSRKKYFRVVLIKS
ncbi:Uncharacterised protein r2_g2204 [Pycnogonum litorale]